MKRVCAIDRVGVFLLLLVGMLPLQAQSLEERVDALLSRMTLEEKIGQMTQLTVHAVSSQPETVEGRHQLDMKKLRRALVEYHVGSILNVYDAAFSVAHWQELIRTIQSVAREETRLGIPVLYGIDAIHGMNYAREAVLFPHALAQAASRDLELVEKAQEITAHQMRTCGIPWNFYPVLGLGRQPLWPRLFETYGEDPYLVAKMARAVLRGLQGDAGPGQPLAPDRVAACAKHYIGYSFPLSGKDRTPAWIPERQLLELFVPPFRVAIQSGVLTVMANSGEVNGIPVHSSYRLLTELLREKLGFTGFVVSDWQDVIRLYTRDHVVASRLEAAETSVKAGVDMSMVPFDVSFYHDLLYLVRQGRISEEAIDRAVRRILRVKFAVGLFENPLPQPELADAIDGKEAHQLSRRLARESIVLLKNENGFLPLKRDVRLLVTGPTANRKSVLNGGWTYTWQGSDERYYPEAHPTVLSALQEEFGSDRVLFAQGASFDSLLDVEHAEALARRADVIVACLGEPAYCETPGNIHDINLPRAQWELVHRLARTGKPIVLVLLEGRPRIITPIVDEVQAILVGFLPGPEGAPALAEILAGKTNPSGRLPITYPKYPNTLVPYDYKSTEADDSSKVAFLYPFGYGLSYTRFDYNNLKVEPAQAPAGNPLIVQVEVTNSGSRAGRHVVELYLRDQVRSVTPPVRQLKRFAAVYLKPGEHKVVRFRLSREDFLFIGRDNQPTLEPGDFEVLVGPLRAHFVLVSPANESIH